MQIGFDLDNTLYPVTPEMQVRIRRRIYERISGLFSIPFEQARKEFEELYEKLNSGSKTIAQLAQQRKVTLQGDIIQESLEEADILDFIFPNKELISMLERLSCSHRLALITGSALPIARKKLQKIEIPDKAFTYLLTREDGSKSYPEIYRKWMMQTTAKPGSHLYVGDNKKTDIDVPKSLGIRTCILGKYEQADFQISSILDLENLVKTKN